MAARVDRERFEAVVAEVIADLPPRFRDGLHNIAIVIDDRPRGGHRKRSSLLLGLYEGTPLPERRQDDPAPMPDKITLFQTSLESICRTEAALKEEIRKTLLHEIGHYFGLTEAQLEALGY